MYDARTPMADEKDGLTILGQKVIWPSTLWGTAACGAMCAAVVLCVYFILHAPPEHLRAVGVAFFHAEPNGPAKREKGERSYGFWTPSPATRVELQRQGSAATDDEWMATADEKKLKEFAKNLRNTAGVQGYRRAEVWGHGRGMDKPELPGLWWTVRAKKNFSVDKLSAFYHEQWKNTEAVYIEVFDASGTFK